MKTIKLLILVPALLTFHASNAQKYAIHETNTGKKKSPSQYITIAKKCEMVLLKRQALYTVAISSKSTLTNNAINALAEKFMNGFPKSIDPLKGEEQVVERGYENPREDVMQITYCTMQPGQFQTTDYIQMIVSFDSSGPNPLVVNIQVKNKAELGILTLTEREIHPPVVKAPAPVVTAPVKKAPATKAPATKKPAAKKPAAKKTTTTAPAKKPVTKKP